MLLGLFLPIHIAHNEHLVNGVYAQGSHAGVLSAEKHTSSSEV